MTQTPTLTPGSPHSDPVAVRPPAPDLIGTQTPGATRNGDHSDPRQDPATRSDSDPGPNAAGPGPDAVETAAVETRTATTETADPNAKITPGPGPDGPSPDSSVETKTHAVRTRTASGASALREWLALGGYLNVLTAVVALVASLGQKEFAKTRANFVNLITFGGFDLTPWLAPVVFDVSVAALLHGGLYWARKRHTPWPWWLAAAGIAGLSVFTNLQHTGWQITAPASAALFLIWFLRLFFQYQQIRRDREVEDSNSDEFRKTDFLFEVDQALAQRAWLIARTKPLAAGLAYRHSLGDVNLTKRDLAILLARQYITIYTDRFYLLTHPAPAAAAPAGSDSDSKAKPKKPGRVHWWSFGQVGQAKRKAAMVAEDQVDRFLGLRVVERTGIIVDEVTYAETSHAALLATAPDRRQHSAAGHPAALAAAEHPAVTADAEQAASDRALVPASRAPRRRITNSSRQPVIDATEVFHVTGLDDTVHSFEKPAGNAGVNWKPLDEIKGLEGVYINPELDCRCKGTDPDKRCPWKLVDHVARRGIQVEAVIATVPTWANREERIGKPEAKAAGVGGDGGQMTVAYLLNQLRALPVDGIEDDGESEAA